MPARSRSSTRKTADPLKRRERQSAYAPTLEELRANNEDFQTHSPLTLRLRQLGHPESYRVRDPEAHLRELLKRYERKPTPSHRDDVLNVMNVITLGSNVTPGLEKLVEEVIQETRRPVASRRRRR